MRGGDCKGLEYVSRRLGDGPTTYIPTQNVGSDLIRRHRRYQGTDVDLGAKLGLGFTSLPGEDTGDFMMGPFRVH